MAPKILSIDLATKTGVCSGIAGEAPRFSTMVFARDSEDHDDACRNLLRWIIEYMQVDRPDVVYVEANINFGGAGVMTNADTIKRLVGMRYTLGAAVMLRGVKFRAVKVGDIRKNFFGADRIKGPEAKKRAFEMCRQIGWTPRNMDEADAGALHHYAICIEAPGLAPIITPAMCRKVAGIVMGVELGADPAMLKLAGLRG